MISTIEEIIPPAGEETGWQRPQFEVFAADEADRVASLQRPDGEGSPAGPLDQALMKLLHDLVVGMPALAGIQALRIWLYQAQECSVRLHLLMDGLPAKVSAGMEFPLDESIANWVWQYQRPLIIAAETETRFPDFAGLLLKSGIKHFCAVPLMHANRRIGVLGLAGTRPDVLGRFDLDFINGGAANIAGAIQPQVVMESGRSIDEGSGGEVLNLEDEISSHRDFEGIIGRTPVITALCRQIKVVAPTDSTALILGETGTGKELIARAIHNLSSRRSRPFIKVNCAAIPAGLIESELFGHERGAFTGAVNRRIGRFEMADGGTLFLDEIGDIPLELQPKLLRVLQEQEFERVGSTQTLRVNVRIVAATSRDLPQMVAAAEFRADLYYRLNVFPLRVPALRERAADIPLLVWHFVELYADKAGKRITEIAAETMDVLSRYAWPGNVRELQNIVERAVILSPGKVLEPPVAELKTAVVVASVSDPGAASAGTTMKDAQRQHILQALAETNWVVGGPKGAAARLGLQRTTLMAMMHRLGISRIQA
jgi:formate hydrogenlyase transcriptional activator